MGNWRSLSAYGCSVMPGPDPGIHEAARLGQNRTAKTRLFSSWIAGPSPAMTRGDVLSSFFIPQPIHQRLLLAAVHFDHRAVDHVHQRRGEHDDEVGHLLDLGDAAHWDRGWRELVGLLIGK